MLGNYVIVKSIGILIVLASNAMVNELQATPPLAIYHYRIPELVPNSHEHSVHKPSAFRWPGSAGATGTENCTAGVRGV